MTSLMVVLYNFVILSVAPQRGFVVYNNNNKIHSGSGNGRVYADLTPALVGRESISDQSGFAVYLINCKIKKSNVFLYIHHLQTQTLSWSIDSAGFHTTNLLDELWSLLHLSVHQVR